VTTAYDAWSARHDGLDASGSAWVQGWVWLTDRLAAPLARRGVPADAVTVVAVATTALVPVVARRPGAWPALAAPLAVVAGVLDGVDGAVASRSGTTSARGRVVDASADRVADVLLATVPVALGAPRWLGAVVAAAGLAQEGVRERARRAGRAGPGTITVSERPTRVIVPTVACLVVAAESVARRRGVGLAPTLDRPVLATLAASTAAALAGTGLAQVARSV
jgi:phosphatidylglycerophosphate synthase